MHRDLIQLQCPTSGDPFQLLRAEEQGARRPPHAERRGGAAPHPGLPDRAPPTLLDVS